MMPFRKCPLKISGHFPHIKSVTQANLTRRGTEMVTLSRFLIFILGLLVWCCFYLDGWLAYRLPRGSRRTFSQLMAVAVGVCLVITQIQIMEHLAPNDAQGNFFFGFVMIEFGGGIVVLFWTLFRGRRRALK
jgi:hypothetical protein